MNTQDFDMGFRSGVYIGIVVAIVVSIILWKKIKKNKKGKSVYYDERQERIRGQAFRYGFYAMIIWIAASSFIEFLFERTLFDRGSFAMITVLVGVGVNVFYSILNGSYFYVNMNKRGYIIMLIVFTAINLLSAVMMIMSGGVIVDGMLTYKSINLLVTILLVAVLLAIYIRDKAEKMLKKRDDE